jgi:hypothetical protein
MKIISAWVAVALLSICSSSMAQWQWLDKDGRKVFSDRSPPPDVLEKDIVKRPEGKPVAKQAGNRDTAGNAAEEAADAPAAPLPAGTDKTLEAKKQQAADAEALKKKAEEDRLVKARVENCAQAKQAMANLDSGMRIARSNAAGEREVLDDAGRAAERARTQKIMATECR